MVMTGYRPFPELKMVQLIGYMINIGLQVIRS